MEAENKFEGFYIIGYGLSGGFGGVQIFEVVKADNQEEADTLAWGAACEEYEQYAGSNGLRDISEIMEEEDIDNEEDAEMVYNEERDGWLDYIAVPYSKEAEEKYKNYHYENNFTEITDI
jgi:hypothetical protein